MKQEALRERLLLENDLLIVDAIAVAKGLFAPKNIWLCVFAPNKTAMGLYKKLGFRKFAVYPGWIAHRGGYVDDICMKL